MAISRDIHDYRLSTTDDERCSALRERGNMRYTMQYDALFVCIFFCVLFFCFFYCVFVHQNGVFCFLCSVWYADSQFRDDPKTFFAFCHVCTIVDFTILRRFSLFVLGIKAIDGLI